MEHIRGMPLESIATIVWVSGLSITNTFYFSVCKGVSHEQTPFYFLYISDHFVSFT